MESSAVYSHAAARDLLCLYTRSNPEALIKIKELYSAICTKREVSASAMGYDFTSHDFVVGYGDCLLIENSALFRARAMRDYMAEQAKALAKLCADPALPHLEDFTLRYLQHKLLKNTKCATIEEYISESNSVQMTHDFLERLETLAAGLVTRGEKAIEWEKIRGAYKALWIERMKSLIPFDTLPEHKQIIYLQGMESLSPPEPCFPASFHPAAKSGELFDEFRFNGMRFAFFMESLTGRDLVLDMPQHHVFILAPILRDEPCRINAAAVYIMNDVPDRSFVKGASEVVTFAHKENFSRKYSVSGHPVHLIEGGEVPALVKTITATLSNSIKAFSQHAYASNSSNFFDVLCAIGLEIVKATPFEQVRQKLKLPPEMTREDFVLNFDVVQFLNAFFQNRK